MFLPFLDSLRRHQVPVSLREWLDLMAGMQAGVAGWSVDGFYSFARLVLVKDERHMDRFDRAFSETFSGLETIPVEALVNERALPREWLEKLAEKLLTDAEKAAIEGSGSFQALMDKLRERLAEQQGRHQGGNKWVGT
ncbi:MAG: VWA domain-containing protein, partial [Pararhodobacter sp.]